MWPLNMSQIYEYIFEKPCQNEKWKTLKIHGLCSDSRQLHHDEIFVAIEGEKFDGHTFLKTAIQNGVGVAIVNAHSKILETLNPDEKNACLFVEDTIEAYRKIAKNFRQSFSFPVIAIGGSNGKTTTKEFLTAMLRAEKNIILKTQKSENGFLGIAITLTQRALQKANPPDFLVVEIGIDSLNSMDKHVEIVQPNLALLTALGPEHLEGLKTWEAGIQEEMKLFSLGNWPRIWQLNDEKIFEEYKKNKNVWDMNKDFFVLEKGRRVINQQNVYSYEISQGHGVANEIQIFSPDQKSFHLNVPMPGAHNVSNFMLSFCASKFFSLTDSEIKKGLATFSPPKMRSEIKTFSNGVTLYNDTYNSSPMSLDAGLESLKVPLWGGFRKIIFLGDMLELDSESRYWHEKVSKKVLEFEGSKVFFCGQQMYYCYRKLTDDFKKSLLDNNISVSHFYNCEDLILFLQNGGLSLQDSVLYLKASRGIHLDRVAEFIEKKFLSTKGA